MESSVETGNRDNLAAVKLHPALLVTTCLITAIFGRNRNVWSVELDVEVVKATQIIAMVLYGIGISVLILAYGSFARATTTINPSEHSARLVSIGIYSYSRNPIYLGWFVVLLGMGLRNSNLFVLLIAVLMIVLLYWAVILKEERYLEARFGEEYARYKNSVRRWL